eukprot:TRINITY_DN1708_c0_g1_i1.p1 TRINITY_DN1708_c0_g1~~TRINITY_DN1708_c0_g1_i1.p1  ORF type:complete len:1082 (-),score=236.10 TRINITY_DN1708_c0_g1_i1:1477-4722(-)
MANTAAATGWRALLDTIGDDEGDETCRVCRMGTSGGPLVQPCRCKGSIRCVHEACLIAWLKHSNKTVCELCSTPFTFTPVYAANTPSRLARTELVAALLKRCTSFTAKGLRFAAVWVTWLFFMPLIAIWTNRLCLLRSMSEARTVFSTFEFANVLVDVALGISLVCCMLCTLMTMVTLRDAVQSAWQHTRLFGPQHLQRRRAEEAAAAAALAEQQPAADVQADIAVVPPPVEPVAPVADTVAAADHLDERVAPQLDDISALEPLPQQPIQSDGAPQPDQPAPEVAQVVPIVNDVAVADAIEAAPVAPAADPVGAEADAEVGGADAAVQPAEDDVEDEAEAGGDEGPTLHEILGLEGPPWQVLESFLLVVVCQAAVQGGVVAIPFHCGRLVVAVLNLYDDTTPRLIKDGTAVVSGLALLGVVCLTLLAIVQLFRKPPANQRRMGAAELMLGMVRVAVLLVMEIVVFPVCCGAWMALCAEPATQMNFDAMFAAWTQHPITFTVLAWIAGMVFMLGFALLLSTVRKLVRPGMMWFVRDPDDPTFSLIREMLEKPGLSLLRHYVTEACLCFFVFLLLVRLPLTAAAAVFPEFFPLSVGAAKPLLEIPLHIVLLQLAIPAALQMWRPRVAAREVVDRWLRAASALVGLDNMLLPDRELVYPRFVPPRVVMLVLLGCFTLGACCTAGILLPVATGRFILSLAGFENPQGADVLTAVLGCIVLWVAVRSFMGIGYLWNFVTPTWLVSSAKYWAVVLTKGTILTTICAVVIPLEAGTLWEALILTPLHVSMGQSVNHSWLHNWGLGISVAATATRLFALFNQPLRHMLSDLTSLYTVNLLQVTREWLLPIMVYLMIPIAFPYGAAHGILPMCGLDPTGYAISAIARFGPHGICVFGATIVLVPILLRQIESLHASLLDEKYLIGRKLMSYEGSAAPAIETEASTADAADAADAAGADIEVAAAPTVTAPTGAVVERALATTAEDVASLALETAREQLVLEQLTELRQRFQALRQDITRVRRRIRLEGHTDELMADLHSLVENLKQLGDDVEATERRDLKQSGTDFESAELRDDLRLQLEATLPDRLTEE